MQRTNPARVSRRALLGASLAAGAAAATGSALARPPRSAPAALVPPASTGDPADLFRQLGDLVVRRMTELKIPGVAVGVIAGGTEHAAGFGVTNVDHPLPVDAQTLFQVGSISKTYTGTAVMRLVEQGQLDLEAPVRAYLPDFWVADAAAAGAATLRHLVTHTAGWFGDHFADTGDGDDAIARYVAGMAELPQIAPLGKYFSYNNAAVVAAGRVIEVVSGQPYEAALGELVLKPLGLERSFLFPEEVMTEAFAVGHGAPEDDPGGDPVVLRPWAIPRGAHPAGGLVASVADLLRFARFHLGDGTAGGERVLSADGLRRMQSPLAPGGAFGWDLVDGVGVSWFLSTVGGARVVFHGGGTNGQQAFLALVPELEFAVAVLTNADSSDPLLAEATTWALERFLGLSQPLAAEVPLDPGRLAGYVGRYELPDGRGGTVEERDGTVLLTRIARAQPPAVEPRAGAAIALVPIGGDRFRLRRAGPASFVDFERGDGGAVGWVRLGGRLAPRVA